MNSIKKDELFTVRKDVHCIKCGNKGAVQYYGDYYPMGTGNRLSKLDLPFDKDVPKMSHAVGFGGTIPHECLNCGNVGLIDGDGLEGYKKAFTTDK